MSRYRLAALVVVLSLMAPGLPAHALQGERGGLAEFAGLMTEAGYPVDTKGARELLRNAGIGVEDAIRLLRDNPNNADVIVPLRVEVTFSDSNSAGVTTTTVSSLSTAQTVDQVVALAAGDVCGWAITNVTFVGDVTGWVIAKQRLRTDWCWNSTKTKIVGIPVATPPTASVTTYGWALGATWTESPYISVNQWWISNWKYRIGTSSTLKLCPLHINIGCTFHSNPWIIHDMMGDGRVGKDSGL